MTDFADLSLLLGAITAAIFILRGRRFATRFIAGFFAFWACCVLRVQLIHCLNPHLDTPMNDVLFILGVGPTIALVWCILCLFARLLHRHLAERRLWRR